MEERKVFMEENKILTLFKLNMVYGGLACVTCHMRHRLSDTGNLKVRFSPWTDK